MKNVIKDLTGRIGSRHRTLQINQPHLTYQQGSLVTTELYGETLWFRSEDLELTPTPSAVACLALLPALRDRVLIQLKGSLDPGLREGFDSIARVAHRWWGFDSKVRLKEKRRASPPVVSKKRTGLFFSCGVDSFYSLIEREKEIDDLILVHGFDVALEDHERFQALSAQAQAVANAFGKRLIRISTNLQEHPLTRGMPWGTQMHGAAMIAVANLLQSEINHILIASAYPWELPQPWGTSVQLDSLWSSHQLTVECSGEHFWRLDKCKRILHHPVVQNHLAVCWKNRGPRLNCGRCEKCLRTRLSMLASGVHHPIGLLSPEEASLIQDLDQLPALGREAVVYESFLNEQLSPLIQAALKRLLERSHYSAKDKAAPSWNTATLSKRIHSKQDRTLFEAGSPNREELQTYADLISKECDSKGTVLVLGMTPGLRRIAADQFARVIVVDRNPEAIDLYRDWIPDALQAKETILQGNWLHLANLWKNHSLPRVHAILGDGVFGNLPGLGAHRELLRQLHQIGPEATLIFRKALAASPGDGFESGAKGLLQAYRAGQIDDAEFGFCYRLAGYLDCFYQPADYRLRNRDLYSHTQDLHLRGELSDQETKVIDRYRFDGDNCLLTRKAWEDLLLKEGWFFTRTELTGKRWYRIYPIYHCRKLPTVDKVPMDTPGVRKGHRWEHHGRP